MSFSGFELKHQLTMLPPQPMPVRHVWRSAAFAAGLAVVLIILAAVTWQGRFTYDFEPADLTRYEFELPEKPSIAVLPFDNLSGDPSKDYLGEGLTENIIAVLASTPDLFVIARNSVFTYKGKPTKVQQIAEELGVRYVMEGSIQVQDDRMRVVAQLVDALDGKHLWAEQYDYALNDIFKLQDDLTEKILEEVEVKLTLGEQARRWRAEMRDVASTIDEFRTFVEGRSSYLQWSLEGHRKAERLYRDLYDRHPDTVSSNRLMSWLHVQKFMMQLTKTPAETLSTARHFADKAVDLSGDDQSSETHNLVGLLDLFELKHESAMEHAERAVALSPNGASAHTLAGFIKNMSGQVDEAVELMRLAIRLEPIYPITVAIDLGYALIKLERYGEAQAIFKEIATSNSSGPARGRVLAYLAVIAVFENDIGAASEYVSDLKKAVPNANLQLISKFHYTEVDRAFIERMLNALRRAGLH